MNSRSPSPTLEEVTQLLVELPAHEKVRLASDLWASLTEEQRLDSLCGADAISNEIDRRTQSWEDGTSSDISHEELMDRVRRALNWKSDSMPRSSTT